jgi:hypothetical protein
MARNRTCLPWSRGAPASAGADASFFEHAPLRWPRPDSPEVSVFTPTEEAESHRRWRRAVLRERLSGPVFGAEHLGFGLSAAALATLLTPEREAGAGGEIDSRWRDDDPGGAGEVLAALRSAATAQQAADKPPPAAERADATHAFLDSGKDGAFSNPVSSRADNGLGVRRPAPRGSGGPPESRVASNAERADGAAAVRKAEQAPGDTAGRASLLAEGAPVVSGPMEANVVAVAIAAMKPNVPEAHEDRVQSEVRGAHAVKAAADQGWPPADASEQAKAKDAPSLAVEAKADPIRSQAEAPGQTVVKGIPATLDASSNHGHGSVMAAGAPTSQLEAKATDIPVAKAAQGHLPTEAAPLPANAKDVAAAAKDAAAAAQGHLPTEAAPLPANAKDIDAAKDIAATAKDAAAKDIDAAKDIAAAAKVDAAKDIAAAAKVDAADQAKQADLSGHSHNAAQHTDIPIHKDDAGLGKVLAALPAADTLSIHVPDLWPGDEAGPTKSHSFVAPHPEAAAVPVLHVTGLMGAKGEAQNIAATLPAESGSHGGDAAERSTPGSGEKGGAAVAPIKVQAHGGDAAHEAALPSTEKEHGSSQALTVQALTVDDALAAFSATGPEHVASPYGGGIAGKGLVLDSPAPMFSLSEDTRHSATGNWMLD